VTVAIRSLSSERRNTNHEFGGRRRVSGSSGLMLDVVREIRHLYTRKKWDIVSVSSSAAEQ
jgi:hypothetical protein